MTSIRSLTLLTILVSLAAGVGLAGCDTAEECVPRDGTVATEDVTVGSGLAVASTEDSVYVYFVGTLENGDLFTAYTEQNGPDPLGLSMSGLIEGWKLGLIGMREGGRRKLTIPPTLGYGCRDDGNGIPPNSTLIFDIRLFRVVRP